MKKTSPPGLADLLVPSRKPRGVDGFNLHARRRLHTRRGKIPRGQDAVSNLDTNNGHYLPASTVFSSAATFSTWSDVSSGNMGSDTNRDATRSVTGNAPSPRPRNP